jgi:prolyl oligopeptidase
MDIIASGEKHMTSRWLWLAAAWVLGSLAGARGAQAADDDPYLWLEETDGARALDWVKARNAEAVKAYASTPESEATREGILEVLDSDARIPYVAKMGDHYYNFWRDKAHPKGIWRRVASLDEYRKEKPAWELVLDVDALNAAENESWVMQGMNCLKPEYRRCLISLSRGGADAAVVREFDLHTKSFVKEGFTLPEAKSQVAWIDANRVFVATDFGPGSMTKSGYPRVVKEWKRGTPLAKASTVHEVTPDDVGLSAYRDLTKGFERELVTSAHAFYDQEVFLRDKKGTLVKIDIPNDAEISVYRQWGLITLRTPWKVGGKTYPAGALLATPFDAFMAGQREMTVLFTPTETTSLSSFSWTRNHLILAVMKNVVDHLEVLTPQAGEWKREPLGGAPAFSSIGTYAVDADEGDDYFMTVSGYLEPASLYFGTLGKGDPVAIKKGPAFFDASRDDVHQYFAVSVDGTRVPYFVVAPKDLKLDGHNPTLLYGYGGFEIALQPSYNGAVGRAWLARGGVYVVANIRGGGEYGPRWHQAALKANRPRAYEDFAAVAGDLVARKITSKAHLGIEGGSNGGLLMGNMITMYPHLFSAVVCEVPLLDMKRYTHLSAGSSWMAEYGDPDKPEEWQYIQTFSPYHNLRKGVQYPPVLFTTSTRDDRVGPAQARKMAARMLEMGAPATFYENIEGGHGAAADNKQAAFMSALAFDYLWAHVQ